jgi:exonuclease 3'-5' domain-containing protein 1
MERAHDISLDEPCVAHQAILFMLDVLMRNNKPNLTLEELYDSFGDKSFTPQMLRAVGGNEQGLKQFLLRYPSLFTVTGDLISANSGGNQLPRISTTPDRYLRKSKSKTNGSANSDGSSDTSTDLTNSPSSSSSSTPNETQYESKTMKEIEQEAIAFFRKQMTKREEDWLPIVSVAGHASQSSADIRKFIGPQNEFKSFLLKYPHVFVVRDEFCGLKGRADVSTQPFPPPSPPPKRRVPTINANTLTRNHSFKTTNRYSACGNLMPSITNPFMSQSLIMANSTNLLNPTLTSNSSSTNLTNLNNKPRLTPMEVKAVHYVMRILHKNGRMLLQTIPGLISRAPEQISNIVGFTREDLIQFFKRHSAVFQLHPDGCISVKQDAVKALILKEASLLNGSNSNANSSLSNITDQSLITSSGVILRIFPKYGILNMENNEQVFFDIQSCQFETFADLTAILHPGDRLHFKAMIGPRDGSTKWRSLKTWIKVKPSQSTGNSSLLDFEVDKSDDSSTSSQGPYANSNNIIRTNSFINQTSSNFYLPTGQTTTCPIISNSNYLLTNAPSSIPEEGPLLIKSSSIHSLNSNTNIMNGDFNLYQLENNEQTSHSSLQSINVLNQDNLEPIDSNKNLLKNEAKNNLTSSPSSNSISNNLISEPNTKKQQQEMVTKFMKQSPDNISDKEVSATSKMVSIGCQTISTGDITVTNVFIE